MSSLTNPPAISCPAVLRQNVNMLCTLCYQYFLKHDLHTLLVMWLKKDVTRWCQMAVKLLLLNWWSQCSSGSKVYCRIITLLLFTVLKHIAAVSENNSYRWQHVFTTVFSLYVHFTVLQSIEDCGRNIISGGSLKFTHFENNWESLPSKKWGCKVGA